MIEQALADYLAGRLSEGQYLERMLEIWKDIQDNDSSNIPTPLKGNGDALAYFRLILKALKESAGDDSKSRFKSIACATALKADDIIDQLKVRDWKLNEDIKNDMTNQIEDLLLIFRRTSCQI